jgi:hypothetical protein
MAKEKSPAAQTAGAACDVVDTRSSIASKADLSTDIHVAPTFSNYVVHKKLIVEIHRG